MDELSKCKHCGGEAAYRTEESAAIYATCTECGIRTKAISASVEYSAKEAVTEIWNATPKKK